MGTQLLLLILLLFLDQWPLLILLPILWGTMTWERSPPTPTSMEWLMSSQGHVSTRVSLMMGPEPGREPTASTSLMAASSMSTTMLMTSLDMSPRLSMMALLHILRLLLAMEWLDMGWLMLPLLWLMLPLLLLLLPVPALLLAMVLGMLSVEYEIVSQFYVFIYANKYFTFQ